MARTTQRDLNALVQRINRTAGTPAEPYTKQEDGAFTPNALNYHLSGAYGGWALHQMGSNGTGTRDVLGSGHIPKRDLYNRMAAYCNGLESAPLPPTED